MSNSQEAIDCELDHPDLHSPSVQPFLDFLESAEGEAALRKIISQFLFEGTVPQHQECLRRFSELATRPLDSPSQ